MLKADKEKANEPEVEVAHDPEETTGDPGQQLSNNGMAQRASETRMSRHTHEVHEGDTWHSLARLYYGDAERWLEIYQANRAFYDSPLTPLIPGCHVIIPDGQTQQNALLSGEQDGEQPMLAPMSEQVYAPIERSLLLRIPTPLEMVDRPIDLGLGGAGSGPQPLLRLRGVDSEWESAINNALLDGLRGLASEVRDNRDLDFSGAIDRIGQDAASSIGQFALGKLENHFFPDGYTFNSVWDFAKEYPVLAILGGVAAGYAAYDLVDRKGTISISTGLISGKVNLETMDWEIMLKYKITF